MEMPRKTKTYQPGTLDAPPPRFSAALEIAAQMMSDGCDLYYAQGVLENFCKGYCRDDMWRITHVTPAGVEAIVEYGDRLANRTKGEKKVIEKPKLQRCHGVGSRLGRDERFKVMLEMHAAGSSPEEIWAFYIVNDSTVLALKSEHEKHKKGWDPQLEDLMLGPQSVPGYSLLFRPAGFGTRITAEEIKWAREVLTAGG
jgi:hypothetical protein